MVAMLRNPQWIKCDDRLDFVPSNLLLDNALYQGWVPFCVVAILQMSVVYQLDMVAADLKGCSGL
jgi:hypothetical protein